MVFRRFFVVGLLLFCVVCLFVPAVSALTVGRTDVGGTETFIVVDYFYGIEVNLAYNSHLKSVYFLTCVESVANVSVAIYRSNGVLVASSAVQTINSTWLWREFPFNIDVSSGSYFLAYSGNASVYYKYDVGGNSTWDSITFPNFPAVASFDGFESRNMSIYLDYDYLIGSSPIPITEKNTELYTFGVLFFVAVTYMLMFLPQVHLAKVVWAFFNVLLAVVSLANENILFRPWILLFWIVSEVVLILVAVYGRKGV